MVNVQHGMKTSTDQEIWGWWCGGRWVKLYEDLEHYYTREENVTMIEIQNKF